MLSSNAASHLVCTLLGIAIAIFVASLIAFGMGEMNASAVVFIFALDLFVTCVLVNLICDFTDNQSKP